MEAKEATVGRRVRTKVAFSGVPKNCEGIIDEDYGSGVTIAWDLPDRPLPEGYKSYDGIPAVASGILRDGFSKEDELAFLEVVS